MFNDQVKQMTVQILSNTLRELREALEDRETLSDRQKGAAAMNKISRLVNKSYEFFNKLHNSEDIYGIPLQQLIAIAEELTHLVACYEYDHVPKIRPIRNHEQTVNLTNSHFSTME